MLEVAIQGILIPFIGTTIGAAMVFLLRKNISEYIQKILLGFASGVMIAASIWSLLMPAIEMSEEQGKIGWLSSSIGMLLGIVVLMLIDGQVKKLEEKNTNIDKENKTKSSTMMMVLAVTLHNIPEGMAVRSYFCWIIGRENWNNNCRSYGTCYWNCYSKYSRRSHNFNAIKR